MTGVLGGVCSVPPDDIDLGKSDSNIASKLTAIPTQKVPGCFKVEVFVETYSWKTMFFICFSRWIEASYGNFGGNVENYLK